MRLVIGPIRNASNSRDQSQYETVITGSFNFTKAAEEKNAENLLVVLDKGLAERYTENWKLHAGHSEPYKGR